VLPKVVASTVVRMSNPGDIHGAIYIVDLERGTHQQVFGLKRMNASWSGRGDSRGLRGIAVYGDRIYVAAYNSIFMFNSEFELMDILGHNYMADTHEIFVSRDRLFVTATGYDSILELELPSGDFVRGYRIEPIGNGQLDGQRNFGQVCGLKVECFDSKTIRVIEKDGFLHINNVFVQGGRIFFSGTVFGHLLYIEDGLIWHYADIPVKTHNAQPFRDGVLYNDTSKASVVYANRDGKRVMSYPNKRYEKGDMENSDQDLHCARQGFSRGLCMTDEYLIVGSSPATVYAYRWGERKPIASVNITMNITNAIHGLELWEV